MTAPRSSGDHGSPEDEDSQQLDAELLSDSRMRRQFNQRKLWPWVLHSFILLLNLTVAVKLRLLSESMQPVKMGIHKPAFTILGSAVEYEPRQLEGGFDHKSQFKGTPNPDLDQVWESISNGQIIRIQKEDFRMLKKTPDSAVQLSPNQGGGYMASVEVFHQLHCLNMLRKFTYREYYQHRDPMFRSLDETDIVEHKDHCVDILRQFLMCAGDVGLITYHRIEGRRDPMPDFSTMHQCRKFESIVDWVEGHKVVVT